MCLSPCQVIVFFSILTLFSSPRPLHSLPLLPTLSINLQAKVAEHRRMLRESDKTGHRPRIKGRFGTHAEQLCNWLGEYLLAKYDQTCQLNAQCNIAGYVTLTRCSNTIIVCLFSAESAGCVLMINKKVSA